MQEDDLDERLRAVNRSRSLAARPWRRRFPWWLLLAVPIALGLWALQLMPLWSLLIALFR